MDRRHYYHRYKNFNRNPTATDYVETAPTSFRSINGARAFLIRNNGRENDDPLLRVKLENARKVIRRADKRNLRRQVKRHTKKILANKDGLDLKDLINILNIDDIALNMDKLEINITRFANWCDENFQLDYNNEQVLCEIIIQKCQKGLTSRGTLLNKAERIGCDEHVCSAFPGQEQEEGQSELRSQIYDEPAFEAGLVDDVRVLRERITSTEDPTRWIEILLGLDGKEYMFEVNITDEEVKREQFEGDLEKGDFILDLSSEVKLFKQGRGRRFRVKKIPNLMRHEYENSYLYKLRNYISGNIDSDKFLGEMKEAVNKDIKHWRSKKLKKRRKNRKK